MADDITLELQRKIEALERKNKLLEEGLHQAERLRQMYDRTAQELKLSKSLLIRHSAELAESESRFREIFNTVNDAIFIHDAETGRIVEVNQRMCEMYGITREEALASGPDDLSAGTPPYSSAEAIEKIRLAHTGGTQTFEWQARARDGHLFWVEVSLRFALIGSQQRILAMVRDITERKQAEESIRISQAQFGTIFNQAPLGIALIDSLTGKIHEVNPRFAQIVGRTIEEMATIDWMSITHPDDVQKDMDNMALLNAGKIPSFSMDKRYLRPDGSIVWIRMTIAPLRVDQNISPRHLCMIDDITNDKQEAEALRKANIELRLFRNLLDNSGDIIAVVDPITLRYLDVNEKACRDLGYSREELLSLSVYDTDPSINPDARKMIDEQMQKLETLRFEGIQRRKNGSTFPVEISSSLIKIDKPYMLSIVRDITERRQMDEKIRQLNEELETKVQERTKQLQDAQEELVRKGKLAVLGQVAGSVGHELRNPLGVMSNAVYFLQTVLSDADETTKQYLNIIKDEITASERIVSDLLDSVRTKPSHPERVALAELMQQTLRKCSVPSSVVVKLDISATLAPLRVDPLQIHQVLRNLISNGIEAMQEGGVLEISAVENKQDGTVTVSVKDSGIGMTPEQLGKLFQPLFTTKARGIGLGLVVVKNLAEANGGSVTVVSEAGKGTVFTVTLPATEETGVSI